MAEKKGVTPAQLAINWVRSLNGREGLPTIIPAPGATTVVRVEENAQHCPLSEEEMKTLETIANDFEVSGGRYPDGMPMETWAVKCHIIRTSFTVAIVMIGAGKTTPSRLTRSTYSRLVRRQHL